MEEISQILAITELLRNQYGRNFTLDGKLVGDIGEVLAAENYGLTLLPENNNTHDGTEDISGRLVQIKSSFSNRSYFPCNTEHIPDYFIAIMINNDGTFVELFNGPGHYIYENYILARGLTANPRRYLYTLSGNILQTLKINVPDNEKILKV